jgi:aminomuconate-semialdehyde/2-hydroxymuconate-6-semialdehyde dehydrogenase
MERLANYIGGELLPPVSGQYLDNWEPARGIVYSQIPDSDERDVEMAVTAAKSAFDKWSSMSPEARFLIFDRLTTLLERDLSILANAESRDNGKPITLARTVDIPRAIANFRFYATAAMHTSSDSYLTSLPDGTKALNYTLRQPIGIAGCISPWNLPLYLFTWKIAPALAAGCTVVAKPSEITPMTAFLLSKLCMEAGVPPGVLNIIHGTGPKVGSAIVVNENIPAITFTGGTATGREIARLAAPRFKKLSLELGGKNPNIIFSDCDYEQMLDTTVKSSFSNQGEICLCGSRIFIERPIYERFKEDFIEKVRNLRVGDPADAVTDVGAIVSKQHYDKIMSCIDRAVGEGGSILYGGSGVVPSGSSDGSALSGYFIQPTIIEGLPADCKTNQEEIFGPVVTIMPFDSEDEVVALANCVPYGLSATIWTQNLSRAHRISHKIEAGIIWINCWMLRDLRTPFGGMKESGLGREGGFHALNFFTEEKNVCVKL